MFFFILIFVALKFLIKETFAVTENGFTVSPIDERQISIPFNYTLNKVIFSQTNFIKFFFIFSD